VPPFAVQLAFSTINNTVEHKTCIYGNKATIAAGDKHLMVYGDSNLIISQTIKAWKVKDEQLRAYLDYLLQLVSQFEEINFDTFIQSKTASWML